MLRLPGTYCRQRGRNGRQMIVPRPEPFAPSVAERIEEHVYLRLGASLATPSRRVCATCIELREQRRGMQGGGSHSDLRRSARGLDPRVKVLMHLLECYGGHRSV